MDIDTDLSSHKRDVAFNSVKEYLNSFGGDIVRIGTFKTDKPKSAVQTACRGFGLPVDVGMYLSSLIPVDRGQPRSIKEVVYGDEEKGFEPVREFINQMERYPGLLDTILGIEGLVSGRGTHACFSEDTLVITDSGTKEIKDVVKGDMVLTHDNTYKPVISTMVRRNGDILQIKCYGSLPTTTTSNHKFYTTKGWIEAKKLTTKDYIGFAINNENIIPKGDLPFDSKEFWWFIGRFLGDGWLEAPYRKGIQHNYDKKILLCCNALNNEREDIERNLEALGYGYRVVESGSILKYIIKYNENEILYEYLETFGKYAYGKHFNSDVLNLPKELLEALLKGYFSADGHLYSDGTQSYKTVSKKLCLDIQEAVAKVYNTYTNINVQQPRDELICGRKCNGRIKYEGKFKVNKIKKGRSYYKDGYLWCLVKEVKETNKITDVYNLTVLDNSSYTANGLIVHNCGVVISNDMLKHTATMKAPNGDIITQYDLGDSEYCGLIKYDLVN